MPVSNYLITNILNKIRSLNLYDDDDIDMIRYSLQAILWEIEKIIILFLLFTLLGRQNYFLVSFIALISIRVNAGGFHSETSLNCLIFTFLMFFFSIMILPLLPMNGAIILAVSGFSLIVTLLLAPISSIEKQAIQKQERKIYLKIIAFIVTFIWLAIVYRNTMHHYSYPVLWIIFLQNVQLVFEYYRRRCITCKKRELY